MSREQTGPISVQVPQRIYGDDAYPVWHRRPLPLNTPAARYYGFKPETVLLRAGEVRRAGARPLPCDILLDRDVAVALRDGTTMYTDVFRPAAPGEYPAIVSWSVYGKQIGGQWLDDLPDRSGVPLNSVSELNKFEGADPAFWVAEGYVVLNPDPRGAYKSQGNQNHWGRQLAEDGYDFIEWAAEQDWCNGKVGMAGNSYLAMSQWFIAAEQPPHLAAIAPWEGATDLARDTMRGGVGTLEFGELLTQTFAGETLVEDLTKMAVTDPFTGLYWTDKIARVESITAPAYVVASYDNMLHTRGTFDAYRRIASAAKWLRVHNTQEWPDFYTNSPELLAFFDHYLKGLDNNWESTPRVRISVIDPGGRDDVNRTVASWPPAGYEYQRLYLTKDATLSETPAAQADTLSYSAAPGSLVAFQKVFDREAEIVGYAKVRLWVHADGSDDLDLIVMLHKLDRSGNPIPRDQGTGSAQPFMAIGLQRASRRALDPDRSTDSEPYLSLAEEQRLGPGEIVPLDIAIWPTGLRIHTGETLQVLVMPYHPIPLELPFGSARISLPKDRFTFREGDDIGMQTLGGGPETKPDWVAQQAVHAEPRNIGTHILHLGANYDSHLLLPMKHLSCPGLLDG